MCSQKCCSWASARFTSGLAGSGLCTLTSEGLTYEGSEWGEPVRKHFPIEGIYRLLFGAGEDFEVYLGKEIYYFTPKERRSCVDFYIASKILYDKKIQENGGT